MRYRREALWAPTQLSSEWKSVKNVVFSDIFPKDTSRRKRNQTCGRGDDVTRPQALGLHGPGPPPAPTARLLRSGVRHSGVCVSLASYHGGRVASGMLRLGVQPGDTTDGLTSRTWLGFSRCCTAPRDESGGACPPGSGFWPQKWPTWGCWGPKTARQPRVPGRAHRCVPGARRGLGHLLFAGGTERERTNTQAELATCVWGGLKQHTMTGSRGQLPVTFVQVTRGDPPPPAFPAPRPGVLVGLQVRSGALPPVAKPITWPFAVPL